MVTRSVWSALPANVAGNGSSSAKPPLFPTVKLETSPVFALMIRSWCRAGRCPAARRERHDPVLQAEDELPVVVHRRHVVLGGEGRLRDLHQTAEDVGELGRLHGLELRNVELEPPAPACRSDRRRRSGEGRPPSCRCPRDELAPVTGVPSEALRELQLVGRDRGRREGNGRGDGELGVGGQVDRSARRGHGRLGDGARRLEHAVAVAGGSTLVGGLAPSDVPGTRPFTMTGPVTVTDARTRWCAPAHADERQAGRLRHESRASPGRGACPSRSRRAGQPVEDVPPAPPSPPEARRPEPPLIRPPFASTRPAPPPGAAGCPCTRSTRATTTVVPRHRGRAFHRQPRRQPQALRPRSPAPAPQRPPARLRGQERRQPRRLDRDGRVLRRATAPEPTGRPSRLQRHRLAAARLPPHALPARQHVQVHLALHQLRRLERPRGRDRQRRAQHRAARVRRRRVRGQRSRRKRRMSCRAPPPTPSSPTRASYSSVTFACTTVPDGSGTGDCTKRRPVASPPAGGTTDGVTAAWPTPPSPGRSAWATPSRTLVERRPRLGTGRGLAGRPSRAPRPPSRQATVRAPSVGPSPACSSVHARAPVSKRTRCSVPAGRPLTVGLEAGDPPGRPPARRTPRPATSPAAAGPAGPAPRAASGAARRLRNASAGTLSTSSSGIGPGSSTFGEHDGVPPPTVTAFASGVSRLSTDHRPHSRLDRHLALDRRHPGLVHPQPRHRAAGRERVASRARRSAPSSAPPASPSPPSLPRSGRPVSSESTCPTTTPRRDVHVAG